MTPVFDLERFTWARDELHVAGRWRAEAPRRFRKVRLMIEADGEVRRLAPSPSAPLSATPDGEPWAASFPLAEQPAAITGAELEIGRDLAVALPPPTRRSAPPAEGLEEARREIARERAAVKRMREEAERSRAALVAARQDIERRSAELRAAWAELEAERAALEAARSGVDVAPPATRTVPETVVPGFGPARRPHGSAPSRGAAADPLPFRVATAALAVPAVVALLVVFDSI